MAIYLIEESKGSKTSSEYGVVDYTPRKGKGVKWDLVDHLIDAVKKLEIPGFSLKGACLDRDAVQVYPACTEEEFTKHMNSLKSPGLKAYRNGVYTTGDLYMIMEPASDEDSIILYLYPKDGEDIAGASEESLTEGAGKDWEVKQISMDVAVPKGTKLDVQAFSGNVEFWKAMVSALDSCGYEMAGDIIDSHDVTDVYKSNGYVFFEGCNKLSEDAFDYDENSPEDQGLFDSLGTKLVDTLFPGVQFEDQEMTKLDDAIDLLIHVYKSVKARGEI